MSQSKQTSNAPLPADGGIELSQIIRYEIEHIWVEPVCDFFKISYRNATRTIQNDPLLSSQWTKKSSELMFFDNRRRFLLTKLGFLRWIQIINANTVEPELREKFIQFQVLVFDYVYGKVENSEKERELYASIKRKRELKKQLTDEIRRETLQLNQIYATKYGQLQLDIVEK